MDVKKTFFTFFILVTFFNVFSERFFIFEKRWQSSEQQGS